MLRFDKATHLSLLFKLILSVRLSSSLCSSMFCYFYKFINIVFNLFYKSIEIIILLYTLLVIAFAWYKKNMIWRTFFNKFLDVLPGFTCANNLWSIYLKVNWVLLLKFNNISYFIRIFIFRTFFINSIF